MASSEFSGNGDLWRPAAALGKEAWEAAVAAGRALSLREAIAEALGEEPVGEPEG